MDELNYYGKYAVPDTVVVQTSSEYEHERLLIDATKDGPDPGEVEFFFKTATVESRLAFIRDAQSKHLLDRPQLRECVTRGMVDMGLGEEADRLINSYDHEGQTLEISITQGMACILWHTDDDAAHD